MRKTLFILLLMPFCVKAQIINTIAGNGVAAYNGDGIAATAAELNGPADVCIDAAGNIYIAEYYGNRIRKIDPSGIITTVAGTGVAGYNGDGGLATNAKLNSPNSVYMDGSGNLYISDYASQRVRKVNSAGIISTIAGTGVGGYNGDGIPATAAKVYYPTDICMDAAGDIILADPSNMRIRRINTSGIISTIAGTGTMGSGGDGGPATLATFNNPYGVAIDAAGNIYIGDQINNRVRKINSVTGIVTTIAGTGVLGYSGDGGPATLAKLNTPTQIYVTGSDVFFTDRINNCLRKVNTAGIISTVIGNGTAGFSGDGGPATAATLHEAVGISFDAAGNMYIADFENNRIRKVGDCAAVITGNTIICSGSITTLSTATTGGAWISSDPTIASVNINSGVVTGNAAGTAVINYTNSCGTTTSTITVNAMPSAISGTTTVCTGATTTLSNSVTGGTWTSASSSIAAVIAGTGIVTGAGAGTTLISYTMPGGCFVTTSVTVNQSPGIINGPDNVCVGSTITLSDAPTGGTWGSSGTGATIAAAGAGSITVTGTSAGITFVTYSLTGGCIKTASVTVNPTPLAITGPTNVCTGLTITLSDPSPTGTWTSSGAATVNSSTGVVNGVSAGIAGITYTTVGNCIATTSVTVNQSPGIINGPDNVCVGSTITLSDAPTGGTWGSSGTGATIAAAGAGSITVTGTSAGITFVTYSLTGGCIKTASVTVNPTPLAITGPTNVCTGLTITMSDPSPSGTWTSSGAATVNSSTGVVNGVSAGIAGITYTTVGNCIATTSVTVNQSPGIINGPDNVCVGSTITLSDAPTGGTWGSSGTGATIAAAGAGSITVTGTSAGITFVTYSLTGGCIKTASVTVNPTPLAITGPTNVCTGLTITLSDPSPSGTWTSSGAATVNSSTGVVNGVSAGIAGITYTTVGNCIATTSVTVNQSPGIINGPDNVCVGSTITLSDAPTGGTWGSSGTGATIAAAGAGSITVTGTSAGITFVTYSLTGGCIKTASVTVNPTPLAITGPTNVCTGLTITLSDPSPTGTWTSSGAATVNSSTGVVNGVSAGIAGITYTTAGNCIATTSVTVNQSPGIINGPDNVCVGSTITLSDAPTSGTWGSSGTGATIAVAGAGSVTVTGTSAGITFVTYSLTGGCIKTASVTVNPTPLAITGPSNVCTGLTITLSDPSPTGTWTSSGAATVNSSTGVVNGVSAGIAGITYTTTGNCIATTSVTVNQSPGIINGPDNVCVGSTITLSDAPTSGTWGSSGTGATIAAAGAGSITVTGTSAGITFVTYSLTGGCIKTASVTVNPTPLAITGPTNVCTGLTITLSDPSPSGTWTSSGAATVNSSTGVVNGVSAGIAGITYTTVGNCIATTSVTVNQSPGIINGPDNVCVGSTMTLSDAPTGGTWGSSGTGATIAAAGAGSITVTGTSAGITFVTYSLTGGCIKTASVTVNPQPSPVLGTLHVCEGSTTTLSDTLAGGTWVSSAIDTATITANTGSVNGIMAGITNITYTTTGNCITTASLTVNLSPGAITGPDSVCGGSQIILNDSPAGGTWSSGNTAFATVIQSGTGSGTMTGTGPGVAIISYSLPGGCITTKTITVKPLPSPPVGVLHVCEGATTTLSDTLAGGIWSGGTAGIATINPSTGIVSGIAAGVTVISYSKNACLVTASVTVNITPAINAAAAVNICTDGTRTLTASPVGGLWSSSNPSVAIVASASAGSCVVSGVDTGVTIITYTLGNCFSTTTVTAFAKIPSLTGTLNVCSGRSISLSDSITSGTWSSNNTTIATVDPIFGVITGVAAGNTTITYTIGGSCMADTLITVNQSPGAGIITGLSDLCISMTITLSDSIAGGAWSSNNSTVMISGTSVTGLLQGTDTIKYIVSNSLCADTTTKTLTIYPLPVAGVITGPSVLCAGATISLSDTVTGGIWSSVIPGIATVNEGIVNGLSGGTDTIKYAVSNPGCTTTVSKAITVYNIPDAGIITGQAHICAGVTFSLSDTAANGVWSNSNNTVATIDSNTGSILATVVGTTVISYTIIYSPAACVGMATFTVTVTPKGSLAIDSIVSQIKCYGDNNGSIAVTITGGTPPFLYHWSNGATDSVITGLTPNQYSISVTEPSTECMAADTFQIIEPDSLYIAAEVNKDICKTGTGSIITTITGGTTPYQYLWTDNSTNENLEHAHSGTYAVTVTDMNNCVKMLSETIEDNDCDEITIHDAITPNGDGINDVWVIEGIQTYSANTVQVFDKWGDMVYEKTNYNNDWGGKGKGGILLPDGTYYYLVKLNFPNKTGRKDTFTGAILIKR